VFRNASGKFIFESASGKADQMIGFGMITGGEAKEETRLSRADRSLIRECILDAAQTCVAAGRHVLTRDVRDALLRVASDPHFVLTHSRVGYSIAANASS